MHYRGRISGPLLDRMDLHVELNPVDYRDLRGDGRGESSEEIRGRVEGARDRQLRRQGDGVRPSWNADLDAAGLRSNAPLDAAGHGLLETATARLGLSARSIARIRRVARTIADLAREERVKAQHIAEALQYRRMDEQECSGPALAAAG